MKNFLRALRCAWPYRGRLLLSVLCAMVAASFWGLNFTAIYPVLKIIGSDKNLQQWVEEDIKQTQDEIDRLSVQVEKLSKRNQELDKMDPGKLRDGMLGGLSKELARVESKLESARGHLSWCWRAKRYLDMLCPTDRFHTLALVILLVVLAVGVKGMFEFCQETLVGAVVNRSLFDLRNRFFRNVVHLDVQNFSAEGTHELMARFTNDMELLGAGLKTLFGKVVAEPLRALACVAIACWINWQLTVMFMLLVPLALFILTKVGRTMKRATRRQLERMSSIYKILQETFVGIRVVKAFAREPYERRRFGHATRDYYYKAMWVAILDAISGPVIEFLGVAAIAAALVGGAYLVLSGETHFLGLRMAEGPLESESLLQLYALLAAIADPVRKLSSVYTRIQSGAAASDRIFGFVDRQPKIQRNSQGPRLVRHHTSIEFRDVCFSYDPGHAILTHVDLTVKHGEVIALVGKNGSGKTTLLNMLPRFFDPDHGSVLVDGIDLRVAQLRSLRRQVAIVTQDAILFDDTVSNNIAYGKPHATPEAIETAARKAFAHDFILKLPAGYDTKIGEAGGRLSGGQRQRLALARAILRDPAILILDEFTSQSDTENEARIHTCLREFMKGRTTFVITHRLNTLEIADRIVVIDGSRIVAVGTHPELLKCCSVYQRLHEAQFERLVA